MCADAQEHEHACVKLVQLFNNVTSPRLSWQLIRAGYMLRSTVLHPGPSLMFHDTFASHCWQCATVRFLPCSTMLCRTVLCCAVLTFCAVMWCAVLCFVMCPAGV